jgi:hypothetical protein
MIENLKYVFIADAKGKEEKLLLEKAQLSHTGVGSGFRGSELTPE